MLIEASRIAYERACKQDGGWSYDALTAITFAALAVEALCNAIGERRIDDWTDFESSSPNAKLRILAKDLSIPYSKSDEPWNGARWLFKFRNRVAHAKPELIKEELMLTQEELNRRLFDKPESKLEREINMGNAARAVEIAENMKRLLFSRIPLEESLSIYTDGWSGRTELPPDA